MSESTNVSRTSRRDLLKLTGAAALGAAGTAALGAVPARASGSGATLDMFFNPQHLTHGTLAPGAEVVIGPFPFPGSSFNSDSYNGIAGNLTAYGWSAHGWFSVRPNGMPFDAAHQAINLHFGGSAVPAWSNFFICQFGPATAIGMASDGKFIIRNGPSTASYLVDLHGFLGPDQ